MATTITTLVDKDGNQLLPRTRTEAVVMSDGTTTLESRLALVVTAVDEVLTGALPRDADTLGGIAAASYAKLASPTFTGAVSLPSTTSIGGITSTELGYIDGVTSNIQTQLNTKASTGKAIAMAIVFG